MKYPRMRTLFVAGNVLLFLVAAISIVTDHLRPWKPLQKSYYKMAAEAARKKMEAASEPEEKARFEREHKFWRSRPLEIKQVILNDLGRVDRCITCHVGHDPLTNAPQTNDFTEHPFAAPANEVHKLHPIEKFGCAVCHGGQGLATTVKDGHGEVEHWEQPLLRGVLIQASCAKCHADAESLKVEGKPYATAITHAKQIVQEKGCIGCHQIRGVGGPISVDLAWETADKPLTRIDFSHTGLPKEEWTLKNWIKLHFTKDPAELVPGDPKAEFNTEPIAPSGMPYFAMSDADADAVTTYVLGLTTEKIPKTHYVYAPPAPEPRFASATDRGRYVYLKYGCAACHAADGGGGIRNFNYEGDVEPNLRRSAGTFTKEELKKKIQDGVPAVGKKDPKGPTPPLYMPSWKDKIKDRELDDLATYLQSIAEKTEEW